MKKTRKKRRVPVKTGPSGARIIINIHPGSKRRFPINTFTVGLTKKDGTKGLLVTANNCPVKPLSEVPGKPNPEK